MNKKSGTFAQRAGSLVEDHICDIYELFKNKKQQTHGYYDAYNRETIYEIKAVSLKSDRCTINTDSHNKLYNSDGKYIIVYYDYQNNDKGLQVITDINIKDIVVLPVRKMDDIIKEYATFFTRQYKYNEKKYCRVKSEYIITNGKSVFNDAEL